MKVRSVKMGEVEADKVKDLKRYLKVKEGLSVTEAELLSRAFDYVIRDQYDEFVSELKSRADKSVIRHILENPAKGKEKTDAAKDHDMVAP